MGVGDLFPEQIPDRSAGRRGRDRQARILPPSTGEPGFLEAIEYESVLSSAALFVLLTPTFVLLEALDLCSHSAGPVCRLIILWRSIGQNSTNAADNLRGTGRQF